MAISGLSQTLMEFFIFLPKTKDRALEEIDEMSQNMLALGNSRATNALFLNRLVNMVRTS
jgi:hypothetical protein